MIAPLVEAWRMNNRVSLFLLESISEEDLDTPLEKGKSARAQFAHLVNVRRMWLKMYARDLLDAPEKSDRRKASKKELVRGLESTCEAIAAMIERAGSLDTKLKGARTHIAAQVASFFAHEGFHRGQVELLFRQAGRELPREVQLGVWEWWKR